MYKCELKQQTDRTLRCAGLGLLDQQSHSIYRLYQLLKVVEGAKPLFAPGSCTSPCNRVGRARA